MSSHTLCHFTHTFVNLGSAETCVQSSSLLTSTTVSLFLETVDSVWGKFLSCALSEFSTAPTSSSYEATIVATSILHLNIELQLQSSQWESMKGGRNTKPIATQKERGLNGSRHLTRAGKRRIHCSASGRNEGLPEIFNHRLVRAHISNLSNGEGESVCESCLSVTSSPCSVQGPGSGFISSMSAFPLSNGAPHQNKGEAIKHQVNPAQYRQRNKGFSNF